MAILNFHPHPGFWQLTLATGKVVPPYFFFFFHQTDCEGCRIDHPSIIGHWLSFWFWGDRELWVVPLGKTRVKKTNKRTSKQQQNKRKWNERRREEIPGKWVLLFMSRTIRIYRLCNPRGGGALEYQSDVQVPTGERKYGGIRCKISLKKGVIWCGLRKKWIFFDVDSQKWGSLSVQKCNVKPKFANFMLKLPQNL